MIGIQCKIDDREARQQIDGLKGRLKNIQKPLKDCGLVGLRSISKTFKTGGRPVRWKPSKRALTTGGKTLINTARLLRSITMKAASRSVSWGTNIKYAAIQHLGGTIPGRTIYPKRAKALRWIDKSGNVRFAKKVDIPATRIPAREYLVIQDEDWRVFRRIFTEHLTTER